MAKCVALGISILSMVLMIAPTMIRSQSDDPDIVLFEIVVSGVNIIPVAAPNPPRTAMFGTIFVLDVPLTESSADNSTIVGRSQGTSTVASLDGTQRYASISISFNSGRYRGSTLQAQGTLNFSAPIQELSIPSGTESFRFTSGYVQFRTVRTIPATNTTINEVRIFLSEDQQTFNKIQ